jgi:hypothetical protein
VRGIFERENKSSVIVENEEAEALDTDSKWLIKRPLNYHTFLHIFCFIPMKKPIHRNF